MRLVLLCLLVGCGAANKNPWDTLPAKERQVLKYNYRCAEATRIVNEVRYWEPYTPSTVISIYPKTGAYYTYRSARKKNWLGTRWEHIAVIHEVHYPDGRSVMTYVWLPGWKIPVLMDYYMLREKERTPELDDVFILSQKATGKFFCAQRKIED